MGIPLSEALNQMKNAIDLVNTLWNIFSVVALGVVTFVYSQKASAMSTPLTTVVILAFEVFSLGNLLVLCRAQIAYLAIIESRHKASAFSRAVGPGDVDFAGVVATLTASPVIAVVVFHLFLQLLVVLALVFHHRLDPYATPRHG